MTFTPRKSAFVLIGLTAAAALTTACTVSGDGPLLTNDDLSGTTVTQDRALTGFTSIDVGGTVDLIVEEGEAFSVTVTADEALQPHIDSVVVDGKLSIEQAYTYLGSSPEVVITVTLPELTGVEMSGVATGTITSVEAEGLTIDLSGDADAVVEANTVSLNADLSGSSKLTMRGTGTDAVITASGASVVDGNDLTVATLVADVSGASKVEIRVRETLDAEVSGAGRLAYVGSPTVTSDVSNGAELDNVG